MAKFYNLERDFPAEDAGGAVLRMKEGDYLYGIAWGHPFIYKKVNPAEKKSWVPYPGWHNQVQMIEDLNLLPEQDKAEIVLWLMEQSDARTMVRGRKR